MNRSTLISVIVCVGLVSMFAFTPVAAAESAKEKAEDCTEQDHGEWLDKLYYQSAESDYIMCVNDNSASTHIMTIQDTPDYDEDSHDLYKESKEKMEDESATGATIIDSVDRDSPDTDVETSEDHPASETGENNRGFDNPNGHEQSESDDDDDSESSSSDAKGGTIVDTDGE